MSYDRDTNDAAIRLWHIDETLVWLRRNAASLGLGANAVSESLRTERDELREHLIGLGGDLVPLNERPAQQPHVGRRAHVAEA